MRYCDAVEKICNQINLDETMYAYMDMSDDTLQDMFSDALNKLSFKYDRKEVLRAIMYGC